MDVVTYIIPDRMIHNDCSFDDCPIPANYQCENCDSYYCSDHGTPGGDRQVQDVGAVAYPGRCWKCGGFNADA